MSDIPFGFDPYPSKPKILFVGHGSSTHTLAWVDSLINAELNVRLFCLPGTCPPDDWPTRAYVVLPTEQLPPGYDAKRRESFHLLPHELNQLQMEIKAMKRNPLYWLIVALKRAFNYLGLPQLVIHMDWTEHLAVQTKAGTPIEWLADIIQNWQPDIIHTLGMDTSGRFYFQARNKFHLAGIGKWVLQLRGGSDLTLSRFDQKLLPENKSILHGADQIISDNYANFSYLEEMGISSEKFAPISPVPGTGGIDVQKLSDAWQGKPSQRRIIVWPKAYDCEWSVALPVFEAIQKAWSRIQPCTSYMLAMVTEGTQMWYNTLPQEIRENCRVYNRIPRDDLLNLMPQARVMLAPSLVDGVPNSMYEAMASGAFPIVSPLETIRPVVENEKNVLFARNLYPQEIAEALVRAMTDDDLVDNAAKRNLEQVRILADRSTLGPRIINYYEALAGQSQS